MSDASDPTKSHSATPQSLNNFAETKLRKLERRSLRRTLTETSRSSGAGVERSGGKLISFCCNDYLGLSQHPAVIEAARDAAAKYGAGAGASRLVTGDSPPIRALERDLAAYKNTEAAIVFGSGYLANLGAIPALVGGGDLIVMDALSHSCMHAGAQLSRADIELFRHNDVEHVEALLRDSDATRKLILTETIFSMDGDAAPVGALLEIAAAHDAWLMTDDAHGLGVYKPDHVAHLQMGTLSKSAGSYGGYLCAARPVIELMKSRARTLVFSTGLPPASAAAARVALKIMASDKERCAKPLRLAEIFCSALRLPAPISPIVPIIVGDDARVIELSKDLEARGYLVTGIRAPTVPAGTARLRVTFSADHEEKDVLGLVDALTALGAV